MKLKTPYGQDEEITKIRIGQYSNNGNIAIQLICKDEEYGFEEPYDTLTVNFESLPPFTGFVNVNNVPGIEEFIKENNLGEKVEGYEMRTNFVVYPLYTFNEEKLKELDKDGFDKYAAWCLENIEDENEWQDIDEEPEV